MGAVESCCFGRAHRNYWTVKLGVDRHIADRVLNLKQGIIRGVAAIYKRNDPLSRVWAFNDLVGIATLLWTWRC